MRKRTLFSTTLVSSLLPISGTAAATTAGRSMLSGHCTRPFSNFPMLYGTAWKKDQTTDLLTKAFALGFRGVDTACQPKHYDEKRVGDALFNMLSDEDWQKPTPTVLERQNGSHKHPHFQNCFHQVRNLEGKKTILVEKRLKLWWKNDIDKMGLTNIQIFKIVFTKCGI